MGGPRSPPAASRPRQGKLAVQIKFDSALITGSSRGLGRAIAIKLAQESVGKIAVHHLEWIGAGWTPMWRQAAPEDIANACALLCSEEASFVTGQIIAVDGGSSLMNPDFPLPLQMPKQTHRPSTQPALKQLSMQGSRP